MSESAPFQTAERSNWVRVRTLVNLRWFAILGQTAAVVAALAAFGLTLPTGPIAASIGLLVLVNLLISFLSPGQRRLTEREALLLLVLDTFQLALLLYLTGGLNNPFALLMLAPVAIAATVLRLQSTIVVAGLALALASLLAVWHLPLRDGAGAVMDLPGLFRFGLWAALVIGIVFIASYAHRVATEMHEMGQALVATQMALAREQKLTDLGGVVAAAAHELGTPLATIKLVSAELLEELSDHPDLAQDAALIREQADRCRDILRSMGRAGKEDHHLRSAPLEAVLREAAEPHMGRGIEISIRPAVPEAVQPMIRRAPEVIHGLRNLIQNAVDFAESRVEATFDVQDAVIQLRISDDGPGYPASVIGRIGEPYMRRRRIGEDRARRPAYEGMGLGLFIAKTLLERSGARLNFANGARGGAVVQVIWDRSAIEVTDARDGLGENTPIRA